MPAELTDNSYGKSAVRLLKVERSPRHGRHAIRDLTVDVALSGEFATAHTEGDNSAVLPTDTMKNTVYAKARGHDLGEPEEFALLLARHFLEAARAATRATITVREHRWQRLEVAGQPHDSAFEHGSLEKRVARVAVERSGPTRLSAGIEDLFVLKSAHSAFAGFLRDRYTTLKETADRILATSITTSWQYTSDANEYGRLFANVRAILLDAFAAHDSASVQHTLYAMAAAVIDSCREVEEIRLTMPNKHHLLVDLAPFGMENPNEIFVPTEAPYGLIEATVRRAQSRSPGGP